MNVSFDYDDTLSRREFRLFANDLITSGHDVWIVTMRFENKTAMLRHFKRKNMPWKGNADIFLVARKLNIPASRIIFTNWRWKSEFLKDGKFIWHLDDCPHTLRDIKKHCPDVVAINSWLNPRWKRQCLDGLRDAWKKIDEA